MSLFPSPLWLNLASIVANIDRLKAQLTVGKGLVKETVSFDFPHHLNQEPLYGEYRKFVQGQPS